MKKILLVFPLLFVFLFSICEDKNISYAQNVDNFSTSIIFLVEVRQDGCFSQTISFPTMEELLCFGSEESENYVQKLLTKIKTTLFFPYFYNYFSLSSLIAKPEYKFGGEKANYTLPTYNKEKKTISFSFCFFDDEAYKLYHPQKEDKKSEAEKGFFFSKQKSSGEFLFSQKLKGEEKTVGEFFVDILSTTIKSCADREVEPPKLVYAYQHFSNKIHSNADIFAKNENAYLHVWESEISELSEEKKIEIYVLNPNRGNWYVLAVGSVIFIVIVAGTIHYLIVEKKKRKKQKKEKWQFFFFLLNLWKKSDKILKGNLCLLKETRN